MEVALFIHFSLGSMKPSSDFLVPPWYPHDHLDTPKSRGRSLHSEFQPQALRRVGEQSPRAFDSVARLSKVEASCPMRTHPSRRLWGDLTIPDSHNTICFFINIYIYFKNHIMMATSTGKMMIHHGISQVHMPYAISIHIPVSDCTQSSESRMTRTTAGCLPIYLH